MSVCWWCAKSTSKPGLLCNTAPLKTVTMGNLCCATASDTVDEPQTPSSLTLDRVLVVIVLCFEAATETLPFAPPLPSNTRKIPGGFLPWLPSHNKVWEFTRERSASPTLGPYNLEGLPASYRQVHAALRKTNMCDHFCFFLEAPLRAKLEGT